MDRAFVERLIEDLSRLRDALPRERPLSEVEVEVARAQWLASILAHAPDIISIIDPDGTLLYVSRSMGQGDARDLIGSSSVDYVPPSHRDAWNDAIRRAVDSGEPQHVEIFSVGDFWWDTRLVPIRHDSKVTWLVTIGTDVTARKRAEAELAINQQQLKLALEASGMGQWSWDITTNRVTWDAATKRMFEWPVGDDDLDFSVFANRVHPADAERVQVAVRDALDGNQPVHLQHRILLPSGALRWVVSRGEVLRDRDGHPTRVIGGILDITDGKRSEDQAQRAQKLEAIGQLAGGVAHDFNNLLVAILGNLAMAKDANDGAERTALLDDALAAANRAAEVTRQLLAFGRAQPLEGKVVDARAMVVELGKLLSRLLPETIRVELVPGAEPAHVLGDHAQLEQVLVNLCANARDAMPHGGRLRVAVDTTTLDRAFCDAHPWARPGRYVRITVSDSGSGIPPEVLEHVFEPFFTTKAQGTGLGLATAYGTIHRHGGLLHVRSEVNAGTSFEIYLAARAADTRDHAGQREAAAVGGQERILVAEDEAPVRTVVRRILEGAGYAVIVAQDGRQAVDMFERRRDEIDLVILDAVMPVMGGMEALVRIRALRPDVAALVCSGYSEELHRLSERDTKAAFLAKPYEPDRLLRVVRAQLDARTRPSVKPG